MSKKATGHECFEVGESLFLRTPHGIKSVVVKGYGNAAKTTHFVAEDKDTDLLLQVDVTDLFRNQDILVEETLAKSLGREETAMIAAFVRQVIREELAKEKP